MYICEKINSLTIKQKIAQLFIMGFSGSNIVNNDNIMKAVRSGLGGVIFFTENIESYKGLRGLVKQLQKEAAIPLFTGIDQEGGLVERTIAAKEKTDYLTPMALANTHNTEFIKQHTQIMSSELKYAGINMDFAPVLDVHTNKLNPVIGIRSFSSDPVEVIKYSKPVYKTFQQNNIISVGKHFPGHGESSVDSHIDMPSIDIDMDKLEKIHISPFKAAIHEGIDAVMIAHVHYKAFNKNSTIPASLSKEVITDYLINKLSFKGLIISDDMVMGGITKHYGHLEACKMAIKAGIDLFIFRDSSDKNLELIDKLAEETDKDQDLKNRIEESVYKIFKYKEKYGLFDRNIESLKIDFKQNQAQIDKIAAVSVKVVQKGKLVPIKPESKILVIAPDKSKIFNYSKDSGSLRQFLQISDCNEIFYSLNPEKEEIQNIIQNLENGVTVIFLSYNALINRGQIDLLNSVKCPVIAVAAGIPEDIEIFKCSDTVIQTFCYKPPSLKALARLLLEVSDYTKLCN